MPGKIIEFERATYDFSALANGNNQTVLVAKALDVSEWTEATLLVRSFAHTLSPSTSIVIEVRRAAPTPEDPNKRFVTRPADPLLASITLNNATAAAPKLFRAALTASFGEYIEISVKGTQAALAITVIADLAICVSLKRARGRRSAVAAE